MKLRLLECDGGAEHLGEVPAPLGRYTEASKDGVECASIGIDQGEFFESTAKLGLD